MVQEREGRIGRAVALVVLALPALARAATCARRRSTSTTRSFDGHENSLAARSSSSVQHDVYYAKARGYPSAREASLFHDNVPVAVYDNLIAAVRGKLPAVYSYFELRRRKMKLQGHPPLRHLRADPQRARQTHTWKQAVDAVVESLDAAGRRVLPRARSRASRRPLVRPLPEPGQAERRVQLRHASTAGRTS